MKMDCRALFLVFVSLWKMSWSLRCYNCASQHQTYYERLCQHFDYSEKYTIECEHSTMCYKKEVQSNDGSGLKIYERGCAKQTLDGDQRRTEHGWEPYAKIYEPYEEGCAVDKADPDRVTTTEHCYCRADLCNRAYEVPTSGLIVAFIIPLFYVLRY